MRIGGSRVVVTGAAGLVGGVLWDGLHGNDVIGLDRRRGRAVTHRARMTNARAVRRAFRDADVVVDLAANASPTLDWRGAYENNIRATWTALESAVAAGVRRVVFASSNRVMAGYEHDEPYASVLAGRLEGLDPTSVPRLTAATPPRPDGPYGVSKAFGEAAARYFSDAHGLSVICLRLGHVNPEDRPKNTRHLSVMLSHRDLVQLVSRCIDAPPDLRFAVLYGVSANTWRIWDISEAARLVGYEPVDDAEGWRSAVDA